jgi:hypothetical protein
LKLHADFKQLEKCQSLKLLIRMSSTSILMIGEIPAGWMIVERTAGFPLVHPYKFIAKN